MPVYSSMFLSHLMMAGVSPQVINIKTIAIIESAKATIPKDSGDTILAKKMLPENLTAKIRYFEVLGAQAASYNLFS